MGTPGRFCPLSYMHSPSALHTPPAFTADTVYIIGGLYGNPEALRTVLRMAQGEERRGAPAALVFNGDFNWLDVDTESFRAINDTVLAHHAIKGNVEAELDDPDGVDAGCGCAYPDYTPDDVVECSNAVMTRLRQTARACSDVTTRLAALSRYMTIEVGGERIGVVHGDPESLAGWRFAAEAMEPTDPALRERLSCGDAPVTTRQQVERYFQQAQVRVFASTHTGLPFAQDFTVNGSALVINNGCAGLPNFRDITFGVLTRTSTLPEPPATSLYGISLGNLRCDALPIHWDHGAWLQRFLENWPPGTPGYQSYFQRITHGPDFTPQQAARGSVQLMRKP